MTQPMKPSSKNTKRGAVRQKAGTHTRVVKDKKKEADKRRCRQKVSSWT